jgi:oxygen-dependent protoporphyrinogen oxidase
VILATPAPQASELTARASPELASELGGIRYSSSVIVVLGYGLETRRFLPDGFGILIPRRENRRMLAVTFVHNKFPERTQEDRALLRCFLGGSRGEEVLDWSADEIQSVVCRELAQILHLREEPRLIRTYKWSKAMPLYGVGHQLRVERIQRLVSAARGFALAGNAYGGIGVPDSVRSGREAAAKVLADLELLRA